MGALFAMTVLSTALGWAAPNLINPKYTHYAATALFFVFGVRLLWETYSGNTDNEAEELEMLERRFSAPQGAAAAAAAGGGVEGAPASSSGAAPSQPLVGSMEPHRSSSRRCSAISKTLQQVLPPVVFEAFTMTFLAEWGDRSQIATIGLAANSDAFGVTIGGFLGHAICTGAAVLGGKHLASRVDERIVAACGGVLFLIFGLHSLYTGPPK